MLLCAGVLCVGITAWGRCPIDKEVGTRLTKRILIDFLGSRDKFHWRTVSLHNSIDDKEVGSRLNRTSALIHAPGEPGQRPTPTSSATCAGLTTDRCGLFDSTHSFFPLSGVILF
ncbi:hypothetical protein RRG08_029142 [Elysia crispata]|uniref:Secreted protein n=1 Tax=Elysia crispata TaxID=231223 RepID=A0AAE0Y6T3_9GAST|nr:hypothetical protein RRG08_029142 [Elysia crispata]